MTSIYSDKYYNLSVSMSEKDRSVGIYLSERNI